MKKIALDLDGVVFDSENLFRVYSEVYDTNIMKSNNIIDNTERTFQKRYKWTKEECEFFYNSCAKEILREANLMSGIELVLSKLQKHFKIIIVTARSEEEVNISMEKLQKLNLADIEIFANQKEKINTLVENNVDYIIDDDRNICLNASNKNINAIFFKNNAQEQIEETEYFKTVNNWGEIYKYLYFKEGLFNGR